MPLAPEVETLLAGLSAVAGPPLEEMGAPAARVMFDAMNAALPTSAPVVPATDTTLPGPAGELPVRVYDPAGSSPSGPTLVYFHGGGWVIGTVQTVDGLCRHLAAGAGMRVVSIDYRLAPEAPYPAAAEDCYAATAAVAAGALGGVPSTIAVGGDSAGGNLAAAVSLMARDRGGPAIGYQLLLYPVIDGSMATESYVANGTDYFLTADSMRWFWDMYAPGDARLQPYASPIRAASLADLPAALVVTAEYDPLRDEGEAYARALEAAGVAVKAVRVDGQIHGFLGMPEVCGPSAMATVADIAAALRAS